MTPRYTDTSPLVEYYTQGGGSGHQDNLFGPVYVGSPYVQGGRGIGSFLASLFRAVKYLTIRGAPALGREALNKGA